jgi:hypothetical protein
MVLVGVSYARSGRKPCHLLISCAYARQVWEEMDRLTRVRVGWQGSSLLQSALLIGKISKSLKNLKPSFELLTR